MEGSVEYGRLGGRGGEMGEESTVGEGRVV